MANYTSQVGYGRVGLYWVGAGPATTGNPPLDPATKPWYVVQAALPLPPHPRARRTLESLALFPPFFGPHPVSPQISLQNQGINHRKIGTISVTGGSQGIFVFITGVNQSGTFAALTAKMTRQIGTTGTASIVFNVPSGGFQPQLGAIVTLIENNKTLFSGIIMRRRRTVYAATTMSKYTIDCADWNGILQRHLIASDFSADTLYNITSRMFQTPSINDDHIIPSSVDQTISTGDSFSFSYIKMSDALTQLALSTNTIWWVDNTRALHMILPANAVASAYSVAENSLQVDIDSITVDDNLDNYRNVQYVRTSQEILTELVTLTESHTFTGAAGDIVCPTTYPLTTAPSSVKENGVELVGTNRFFQLKTDGTTTNYPPTDGYYWAVGFYGIWHWPSQTAPINGTVLSVTYTGASTYTGNVVAYLDTAQIVAQQGVSGGSGRFEEIEDYSGSITYTQALALATGIEKATAPPPSVVTLSTIEQVEDIGYAVTVNLPRWGINGTYVIQQIDRIDSGADLGKGTRFRTTLQLVSAKTLGNFTQYFERLLARLNKSTVSAPTEKPTWGLAFDTPGTVSAGLQTGVFGEPYAVQVGLGRILYVAIVFATAADANIVIDIQLNGTSISDSSHFVYTPGNTGTQILYGNLNPNFVNVKRGDLLTLSILQCGTLAPGRNGTVIVVIGQRG